MGKILYVTDNLHKQLKFLATKIGISMQDATDQAVKRWVASKEEEEKQKELLISRIEKKLSEEERQILEALLAKRLKS